MTWTPETLARAFHDAYARISPKFFGTTGNAPTWEEIPEKSRAHMIAVCADVLGVEVETPTQEERVQGEPVPTDAEFERAREEAPQDEQGADALSDWEADLRAQIDRAARRAPHAREPFDGILR